MGIYDGLKDIVAFIQESGNVELLQRFTALQTDVMGLIEKNNELMSANSNLKKELE